MVSSTSEQQPVSSSSSITVTEPVHDLESQKSHTSRPPSHFSLLIDAARLTPEIRAHHYPGNGTSQAPFVVDFLVSGDASDPTRFPEWKKWTIVMLQALATLATSFASSSYTGGVIGIMRDFHVSTIVSILGVSLFVLGFALG
jgi:hypothetical protein